MIPHHLYDPLVILGLLWLGSVSKVGRNEMDPPLGGSASMSHNEL
jgi:hypothetical protein